MTPRIPDPAEVENAAATVLRIFEDNMQAAENWRGLLAWLCWPPDITLEAVKQNVMKGILQLHAAEMED